MARGLITFAIISLSLVLSGCGHDESADMPKNDPVIGKPVAQSDKGQGPPPPDRMGKGSPLTK